MKKIKQDSGVTGFLKSKNAMVFFVLLTVAITMPNTYYVYCMFSDFSPFWKTTIGVASAFVVAGFIMIYTLLKEYQVAKWYAYFEVMISAYYYIRVINNRPDLTWWDLIPALGFTIMLPVSVYKAAAQLEKMDQKDIEEAEDTLSEQEIDEIIEKALVKKGASNITEEQEQRITEAQHIVNLEPKDVPNKEAIEIIKKAEPEMREQEGGTFLNVVKKNKIDWPDTESK